MQTLARTSLTVGTVAALAAYSNAAVVINIPPADGYHTSSLAVVNRPSMSDYSVFSGAGTKTISGSFTVRTTINGMSYLESFVGSNTVSLGTLTFDAYIPGFRTLLHRTATETSGGTASMDGTAEPMDGYETSFEPNTLYSNTTYTVSWTATYQGFSSDSYASLTKASFGFYEIVPEPAPIAVLSLGLLGTLVRRVKGAKA